MTHQNPVVQLLRFDPVVEVREDIREVHVEDIREVHVVDIQEVLEVDIREVQRPDTPGVQGDIREAPDDNREVREEVKSLGVLNDIPEVLGDNQEVREDSREVLGDNPGVRDDNREVREDSREVQGLRAKCLKEIIVLQEKDLLMIVQSVVKHHLDPIQGQILDPEVKPLHQSADEQNHQCQ